MALIESTKLVIINVVKLRKTVFDLFSIDYKTHLNCLYAHTLEIPETV